MIRLLFSFSILAAAVAAQAQAVKPGLWQADSSAVISGIPLPASKDKECISKDDARDIKKAILRELKKTGCESTKWVKNGNKFDVELKCLKDGLEATGQLKGKIAETDYEFSGNAKGTFHGIPATADLKLNGKWLEGCKK
jgi:hypothetical protein